jgi:hypothetical protein
VIIGRRGKLVNGNRSSLMEWARARRAIAIQSILRKRSRKRDVVDCMVAAEIRLSSARTPDETLPFWACASGDTKK